MFIYAFHAIFALVMEPPQKPGTDARARSSQSAQDAVIPLLLTMADTTWRIFTPVVVCVGFGLWADLSYGTKPWLTITGMIVGFAFAAVLIRMQIKKVRKNT